MSENQQPLTEEKTEPAQSAPAEADTVSEENEASVLPAETDDNEPVETEDDDTEAQPEETEEEDIDPADVKIFGMPRVVFHYTAFGVAIGYILAGLIGVAGLTPPNPTICAVVCAVIGYFLGKRIYQKRKAERDRAKAEAENNAE